MATIIEFNRKPEPVVAEPAAKQPRTYHVEVTAYEGDYLEFKANGVKTDSRSLFKIADELRKIASIICSDVMSTDAI